MIMKGRRVSGGFCYRQNWGINGREITIFDNHTDFNRCD